MKTRDYITQFLREEGGLTPEDLYWSLPADRRPKDKRSVMKLLRKMKKDGLVKVSRKWGQKSVWRLTR